MYLFVLGNHRFTGKPLFPVATRGIAEKSNAAPKRIFPMAPVQSECLQNGLQDASDLKQGL